MYSVVENPQGPVFVAVTTEHNPYREVSDGSSQDLVEAYNIDREAEFVKFCCIVDGIISFMNFVMLLNPIAMFPLLASVWGYHGTRLYNYRMLVSFLVYQYIYALGRWGLLGYYLWYDIKVETQDDYRFWLLASILPLMQTYITYRIHRFYNVLKNIYINTTAYSEL